MPDESLSRSEFWQRVAVASLALFGVLATVITMGISFARAVSQDSALSSQVISQQIHALAVDIANLRLLNERRITQLEERQNQNTRARDDHEARLNALERAKPK